MGTFGYNTPLGDTSYSFDLAEAFRATMTSDTGQYLTKLWIHIGAYTAGACRLGFYDSDGPSGEPSTCLWQSLSITPSGVGWLSVDVEANIPLTANRNYWIAIHGSAATVIRCTAESEGTQGNRRYYTKSYGTPLPNPWLNATDTHDSYQFNVYAEYSATPPVSFNTSVYRAAAPVNSGQNHVNFGMILPHPSDSDKILLFARQGASHGAENTGKLIKATYTISSDSWSSYSTVLDTTGKDDRNIGGGVIGTKIILFFQIVNATTSYWQTGYITSTDSGSTWSSFTELFNSDQSPNYWGPYGALFQADNGTWYQPMYKSGEIKLVQSSDADGTGWSAGPVAMSGNTVTEGAAAKVGSNRVICLARNDSVFLRQSNSSNGGSSWGANALSSVGSESGINHGWLYYNSVRDGVIVGNAAFDMKQISVGAAYSDEVYNTPSGWPDLINIRTVPDATAAAPKHIAIAPTGNDRYLVAWFEEPATGSDLWSAVVTIVPTETRVNVYATMQGQGQITNEVNKVSNMYGTMQGQGEMITGGRMNWQDGEQGGGGDDAAFTGGFD